MENNTKHVFPQKELLIFLAVAYGITFLMILPLGISQKSGIDTSVFATAQMFYPAAGVMLAFLLTRRGEARMPRRFFACYLVFALTAVLFTVLTPIVPSVAWGVWIQYVLIIGSVVGWIFLLTEKKEKRAAYGLRGKNWGMSLAMILLFFVLYALRNAVAFVQAGALPQFASHLISAEFWIMLGITIPNFFIVFLPFFGEEYGWRYYLQPRFQKKFGSLWGVILLGVVWGLWHLPLNLFYYSPQTSLQSIAAQLITCITLGVFFAFAYQKTQNIWVAVILHYMNNNLIPVFTGVVDTGNQVLDWGSVLAALLLNGVIFLPFLLSGAFRGRAPLPDSPTDAPVPVPEPGPGAVEQPGK